MKKIKKIGCIIGYILLVVFVLGSIIYIIKNLENVFPFLRSYISYVNTDIEHQAKLFESIINGLFAGITTFGALFITFLHEKRKDRIYWKKEKENRILSVRPSLNVEVRNVSSVRTDKVDNEVDFISLGNGGMCQYANIVISNNGYGKCKGIELEGRKFSVSQLNVDDKKDLKFYFNGLEENSTEFVITFYYRDIFGSLYSQQFKCHLISDLKKLDIEIEEPLLMREEE